MKRPRLSIMSLLLLTGLIATSLTTAMLWREVGPLRREVSRLRDEVGELDVRDETRLHAIRVESGNELELKWRVWVPEGAAYRLRTFSDKIPRDGFPAGGSTSLLQEPGEHVVRYVIRRQERDGQFYAWLKSPGVESAHNVGPWLDWDSRLTTSSGVGESTADYPTDEAVDLIRWRCGTSVKNSNDIPDPAPGFMIWLEPL